ncbi:MAG: peptide transporter permease [Devosia sp.]|uniref:hypothetical protein n=1 Tax=Devosia sp. TaxID=1871048 RepID=UPI002636F19D|nr:hypothetical protein [Devosia sp.]MDB5540910.1 peptide transporter permease [Devosia sp.]
MMAEAAVIAPRQSPDPRIVAGLAVMAIVALLALLSLAWTPHAGAVLSPLAEPSATHWIGTDAAGRDGISLLMMATLTTLLLAAMGTLVSLLIGVPAGVAIALWFGPSQRTAHAIAMLPPALAIGMIVSGLAAPANLTIVLGIAIPGIVVAATITRQLLAPMWAADFVAAARLAGLRPLSVAQRHVAPRLLPQLAGLGLELLAAASLIEISLSFAGLGVLPPGTSLGLLLRESQQFGMIRPLLVIVPGAVAVITALALLLAARGFREARHGAA